MEAGSSKINYFISLKGFLRISCYFTRVPTAICKYVNFRSIIKDVFYRVGFIVDGTFYPKYWSCFDSSRLEVLYVWYEQNTPNANHQTGVTRPSWLGEWTSFSIPRSIRHYLFSTSDFEESQISAKLPGYHIILEDIET